MESHSTEKGNSQSNKQPQLALYTLHALHTHTHTEFYHKPSLTFFTPSLI